MAGVQGIEQTGDIRLFDIDGSSRQGAGAYFTDGTYMEVVPHSEGLGCDLLWTTTMAGYYAVNGVAQVSGRPIISGGVLLRDGLQEPKALSAPGGTAGKVIMNELRTIPSPDILTINLYAPDLTIRWIRDFVTNRNSPLPYHLLHLRLDHSLTESDPGDLASTHAASLPTLQAMVMKCVDRTATSHVRTAKEVVVKRVEREVPLLRAA